MNQITVQDIEAMSQVVDELLNQSDQLTFEQALALKTAALELKKKVGDLISLLETQQLNQLDGQPKQVGDSIFAKKQTGKWRPDARKLKNKVHAFITITPDGTKRKVTISNAVDETIDLMYALYVAPSALPKEGGLKQLGIQKSDICEWENTGYELKEMKLGDDHG